MKRIWKPVVFVVLNLLLVLVLLWSLMIYTSLFKGMPWYEPCGLQFLAILALSDPVFLIIGIALLILGRFFHISRLNKGIPFIAIAGLSLPILIDGSLSIITIFTGSSIGVVLCLLIIAVTIKNLIHRRKAGSE